MRDPELTADEEALLLAYPESGVTDELSLARALGWTHQRVRDTMRSLERKGLAKTEAN